MDYEKAYKEALKLAREYHEDKNCFEYLKGVLENIFPELKESDDGENKRISKEITQFLKQNNGWNREWLAWLEKQSRNIIANSIIAEQEAVLQELKVLHLRMEKQTVCNDAGGNKMWRKAWRFVNEAINVINEDKEKFKW